MFDADRQLLKKSKICIRADGSRKIGLGHLVRCIALAHMLKDDFEIAFYCMKSSELLERELMGYDFDLIKIHDEEQFFAELSDNIIVILDGYYFDTAYQRKVKETGCRLVCIDDLHDKEFMADLIINQAPGVNESDYKAQSYTKFALGLEYALLRPAFLEQAQKPRTIQKIENVLICFGGSDYLNLTQSVLNVVLRYSEFKKIIVITGAAFKSTINFERLLRSNNRLYYRHDLDEKQMLTSMLETDLAIIPASGILFEAMACKCIILSCWFTENQKLFHEYLKNNDLIFSFGDCSNGLIYNELEIAFSKLLTIFPNKMRNLYQGSFGEISANFINAFSKLDSL